MQTGDDVKVQVCLYRSDLRGGLRYTFRLWAYSDGEEESLAIETESANHSSLPSATELLSKLRVDASTLVAEEITRMLLIPGKDDRSNQIMCARSALTLRISSYTDGDQPRRW
jgi:hypothetical protein